MANRDSSAGSRQAGAQLHCTADIGTEQPIRGGLAHSPDFPFQQARAHGALVDHIAAGGTAAMIVAGQGRDCDPRNGANQAGDVGITAQHIAQGAGLMDHDAPRHIAQPITKFIQAPDQEAADVENAGRKLRALSGTDGQPRVVEQGGRATARGGDDGVEPAGECRKIRMGKLAGSIRLTGMLIQRPAAALVFRNGHFIAKARENKDCIASGTGIEFARKAANEERHAAPAFTNAWVNARRRRCVRRPGH